MSRPLSFLLLVLLLGACASRQAEGPSLTKDAGWRWEILPSGSFDLAVASAPPRSGGDILVVYLEGDGFAFVHPRQPSLDPTPTDPVALRLALAHPGRASVAWIARPCQYTLPAHGRNCATPMWTSRRYAPEVVEGMGLAIDTLKARAGAARIILVGYSGGGALAVLLVAGRHDVVQIVTVVADLDLGYWTERDGLSPLAGSLDPVDVAGSLGAMPQIHFTGEKDTAVGTDVVASYIKHLPPGAPVQLREVSDFTHGCCWARDWPILAANLAPGW
ncbi:hypothetical protein [Telmatospirillum siberiense]|uniref:Alpha/beta hydrolase n=1 Tax=Telmatospirillum siberiense TaxID=382514 RepID=A0A2N3PXP4_9PROT|nr:hypothetical protein [Telmatospirillum siberiense]PKU25168.1 hypothetical protein CWS72_08210 [Telmatospirillum siberiense]